jgi:hypothetical protein
MLRPKTCLDMVLCAQGRTKRSGEPYKRSRCAYEGIHGPFGPSQAETPGVWGESALVSSPGADVLYLAEPSSREHECLTICLLKCCGTELEQAAVSLEYASSQTARTHARKGREVRVMCPYVLWSRKTSLEPAE